MSQKTETLAGDEPSAGPDRNDYPASIAQIRLWRDEQADPGGSSRNVAVRWRLDGPINPATIRAAFDFVTSRHEALRTQFAMKSGKLVQQVLSLHRPALGIVDLTRFPEGEREARAVAMGEAEARMGFDLASSPPWRATLLVLRPDRAVLLVTLHNIIGDGWSVGVLARDLGASMAAIANGQEPHLPELPLQYVDYALWQADYLASEAFGADAEYWGQHRGNSASSFVPRKAPAAAQADHGNPIVSMMLPESLVVRVEAECKAAGVSLYSAAVAALALAIRAQTDNDAVALGTQVAGRDAVELEGIIGPLANTLLLNLDISGDPTLRALLKRTGETIRDGLVHQSAPFEAIAEPPIDPGTRPYGVNLILQRSFIDNARYGDVDLVDLPSHSAGALYDLSFFMIGRPEGWRISCELDPARVSGDDARTLLESWRSALESIADAPHARLHALDADLRPANPREGIFPCTPAQRRCWFLDQMDPGSPALNIPVMWEVRGPTTARHVEEALRTIIARHEVLRTRLVEQDARPFQQPADDVHFDLGRADLSQVDGSERSARIEEIRQSCAQAPFDLSAPPLMRATLVRSSPTLSHLIVVFHQSVFDGWSIRVFAREFGKILQSLREGRAPSLPPLSRHYADFAVLHQARLQSDAFGENRDYWLNQLRDAPYFEIAPDVPRDLQRSTPSATLSDTLPPEAGGRLEAAAQALGVTTFAFGCASVGALLQAFTGRDDIVVGTQAAGRREADEEALIGVFINNLVLRFRPSANGSFADCVKEAAGRVQDALAHQDMPFDHLVELLNPPRDLSRTPLIAVNIVDRRSFLETVRYGEIEIAAAPASPTNALYDLTFELVGHPHAWELHVEYNKALYSAETAGHLLQLWRRMLSAVIADPQTPLSDFAAGRRQPTLNATEETSDPAARSIVSILKASGLVDEVALRAETLATGKQVYRAMVTPDAGVAMPLERLPGVLRDRFSSDESSKELLGDISVLLRLPRAANGSIDWTGVAPSPAAPVPSQPDLPVTARQRDMERTIGGIWSTLLRTNELGPDANFFQLGGHSLLALRMLAAVKTRFGAAPKVMALFREPTVRGFARQVMEFVPVSQDEPLPAGPSAIEPAAGAVATASGDGSAAQIIAIQPEGENTPIIALNNTVIYYNLAQRIGRDRPFIGVQMYDPEAPRELAEQSLESIASDFVAAIRQARPKGPYVLMGLCVSGAIALEVAQQLRRAGEEVPLLIQADASLPNYLRSAPLVQRALHRMVYRARVLGHHIARVAKGQRSIANVLGSYEILNRIGLTRLALRLGWIKEADLGEGWSNSWFQPQLEDARRGYSPTAYDGDVAVFLSDEVGTEFLDPQLGWKSQVSGKLVIARTPGWHAEMFSGKGADIIASTLEPMLKAIDGKAGRG